MQRQHPRTAAYLLATGRAHLRGAPAGVVRQGVALQPQVVQVAACLLQRVRGTGGASVAVVQRLGTAVMDRHAQIAVFGRWVHAASTKLAESSSRKRGQLPLAHRRHPRQRERRADQVAEAGAACAQPSQDLLHLLGRRDNLRYDQRSLSKRPHDNMRRCACSANARSAGAVGWQGSLAAEVAEQRPQLKTTPPTKAMSPLVLL